MSCLAKPITWLYRRTGSPARIARTHTLWPGGTRPATVTPSASSRVPPTSCRRAMTTLSAGWMRMVGSVFMARAPSAIDQRRMPRVDRLPLLAQALDAQAHHVARLQVHRVRLHAHAHARRRAGGDQVARLQRREA